MGKPRHCACPNHLVRRPVTVLIAFAKVSEQASAPSAVYHLSARVACMLSNKLIAMSAIQRHFRRLQDMYVCAVDYHSDHVVFVRKTAYGVQTVESIQILNRQRCSKHPIHRSACHPRCGEIVAIAA